MSIALQIYEIAKEVGAVIATAESCTGGQVAASLTDVTGSSAIFDRGFVTYSNDAKMQMLGVCREDLDQYGAVSQQVAQAMATGALTHSNANLSVSITGIAGPGGSDFKPEGRVCFGLAQVNEPAFSETVEFGPLGRIHIRRVARDHALALLLSRLKN